MATRLKTVDFAFPVLASLTNNVLANLTQITVFLPETGVKTIRKAWVEISMDDIVTATGGSITTKTVNLRLGAAGYTSTTNANTLTNTGENLSLFLVRDFTSHFITNWTGTSMTCDVQLQINQSTGTTLGMVNVCCILYVTYEYDDTSTTQIKTVHIPLNTSIVAGVSTSLPTTKTSHDTIPALDTYLPEASKTYRNIHIVRQANEHQTAATDFTITQELSSLGTVVSGNHESALISDRWSRYVWNITSYITTNTTHTFNVWSSLAGRYNGMQAWLVVTYEFNATTTSSVMNSMILPMEILSPMGGTSANDFQRSDREFWIQEPNPTINRIACYVFWQATANETGLGARVGVGTTVLHTQVGSGLICGNKSLMLRNDSPTGLSFGRGRNKLQLDIYNTSTTQRGGNVGSFWIVNYTSNKHPDGVGAHNHTVMWPVYTEDTGAAVQQKITVADAPIIPETNYFITGLGLHYSAMMGVVGQGLCIKIERLTSEGGLIFEPGYTDIGQHDSEMGYYQTFSQTRQLFKRWPDDAEPSRLNIETSRRYVIENANAVAHHMMLKIMMTYHTITYPVSGTITGSNGGIVNLSLIREVTGDIGIVTTRSGNGIYTFTWYDNTENVYVSAYETNNYIGRSGIGTAG